MEQFRGYPCPGCGYDPAKAQKAAFEWPKGCTMITQRPQRIAPGDIPAKEEVTTL